MPRLLDPLTIGSLTATNRFVLPPMRSRKAAPDGYVTDEIVTHYAERSEGAGIAIVEHAYVVDWGRVQTQLGVSSDRFVHGLGKLAQGIHSKGAAAVLQMSHAGSHSSYQVLGTRPVAPSAVRNPRDEKGEVPRIITKEEIQELVEAFAESAKRAIEAHFEAVEIHCAHGFLLSEFISPLTNRRTDKYGGSIENRIRLPEEVVRAIRKVVDKEYPVFCRFPATYLMPGGLELSESIVMAKSLVAAGVDVLDVSGGIGGIEPPEPRGQGFFVSYAEAVKKATGALVVGVGGIVDYVFADDIIRQGRVDLVAVGRPLLKDPTWFAKAAQALKNRAQ
jgi:NADPH2 dehydrogenase